MQKLIVGFELCPCDADMRKADLLTTAVELLIGAPQRSNV
ncbi:MAG: hypothetical protein RJA39_1181 [Pseudomonadota bacterium]|jgi:hypothetical protein